MKRKTAAAQDKKRLELTRLPDPRHCSNPRAVCLGSRLRTALLFTVLFWGSGPGRCLLRGPGHCRPRGELIGRLGCAAARGLGAAAWLRGGSQAAPRGRDRDAVLYSPVCAPDPPGARAASGKAPPGCSSGLRARRPRMPAAGVRLLWSARRPLFRGGLSNPLGKHSES